MISEYEEIFFNKLIFRFNPKPFSKLWKKIQKLAELNASIQIISHKTIDLVAL